MHTQLGVKLKRPDNHALTQVDGLLDSGATGLFMEEEFAKGNDQPITKLPRAIPVYNIDGTQNSAGSIMECCMMIMHYRNHHKMAVFYLTDLGKMCIIIGHTWLVKHNLEIDWKTGNIKFMRCPSSCGRARVEHLKGEAKDRKTKEKAKIAEINTTVPEPKPTTFRWIKKEAQFVRMIILELDDMNCGPIIYKRRKTPVARKLKIFATQNISQRIALKAKAQKKTVTFEEVVPKAYQEYRDLFEKKGFDELPPRRPWDHAIDLKPGMEPMKVPKVYLISPKEEDNLNEFLDENLKTGCIRPSKSPWASGFFFGQKKDGSLCPIQDYRPLNSVTIKNTYPLPLISDIISRLQKAKHFTKMDVRWGFNNIRIKEGDEAKAAFLMNRGLFEPTVMFFGLCNSLATFQTMMNMILRDQITRGKVMAYMDDILIYTETLEEHRKIVLEVLEILRQNKLYLKLEKCDFEKSWIEYLGVIIENRHVSMEPKKVAAIKEWPTPKTLKDAQSFLGFCNFYRKFIKGFAEMGRGLYDLSKKDQKFEWTKATQESFDKLKEAITTAPVLSLAQDHKPYKIKTDASDFASGAVLSQKIDGKWHLIVFYSRGFTPAEHNYTIHDKEMLAIMRSLSEWRHYVQGSDHKIKIYSDHKNLQYFLTARKLNR